MTKNTHDKGKNEMIAVSFIFVKSWYSKASVNVHDRTKILKNCVKPKTTLTKACIIILNIRPNWKFVQKLCYTKVSSKVRGPTKKPCYLENHTNWNRVNWGLTRSLEIFQFKSWNRKNNHQKENQFGKNSESKCLVWYLIYEG